MALDVWFTDNVLALNAASLVAIIAAAPGNVELSRGAWLQARAQVMAVHGDVAAFEHQCRAALGADVWGLLEGGNG